MLLATPVASAQNSACPDGDRGAAQRIAAAGQFSNPVNVVYSRDAKIELRHSASNGCGWALMSGSRGVGRGGSVWIDRSDNGGDRWQGPLGKVSFSHPTRSSYTGTFDDRGQYVIRACGQFSQVVNRYPDLGPVVCTPWFGGYTNRLNPNVRLHGGQSISSPNTRYRMSMELDGNLVVRAPEGRAVWASNTSGNPGEFAVQQFDGNLVVVSPSGRALWASGTNGNTNAVLQMQDDGNAVIYAQGHRAVWQTNTAGR